MSVVQTPGKGDEDSGGGVTHGGWTMPSFDHEVMAASIAKGMRTCRRPALRPTHLAGEGGRLARSSD
jgi:hypothetical protein